MPKNENPFLPDDFTERLRYSLPPDHPANETTRLTQLQSFAFPILTWFFDKNRNLGQGRTHLMAYVCIELAMRGDKIYLDDLSMALYRRDDSRMKKMFLDRVVDILRTQFKDHEFEIIRSDFTLRYLGRKPR